MLLKFEQFNVIHHNSSSFSAFHTFFVSLIAQMLQYVSEN